MRRKKQQLKVGILVTTMALSAAATPVVVQAEPGVLVSDVYQRKELTSLEKSQLAIDFLSKENKDAFKEWDQSLGTMTEQESTEIKAKVDELIAGKSSDYEKTRAIFDWIVQNVKYHQGADVAPLRPYDVFKKGTAVCGGYSRLYKAMLNLAGIPSVTVSGQGGGGGHEWNLVYANDGWFYSDSTWGTFDQGIEQFSGSHDTQQINSVTLEGDNDTLIGFWNGVAVQGVRNNTKLLKVPEMFHDLKVTAISGEVFNRTGIEKLEVSKNVTTIDTQSAPNATELKEIVVDSENTVYTALNGVLFTKDKTEILHYPAKNTAELFNIPAETVKLDLKQTFTSTILKDIYVQEDNPQFSSNEGVVYNKAKDKLLIIPEGKTSVTVLGSARFSASDVSPFNSKKNIQEVVLEEGITEIPTLTFNNCSNLRKITIPESVTKIDDYAFDNMDLTKLTIHGKSGSYAETFAKNKGIKFSDPGKPVEKPEAELQALSELIAEADQIDKALYTDATVQKFEQALKAAKEIVIKEDVTKAEVEQATEALQKAKDELTKKPANTAELTELNALITDAKKIDLTKYTEVTVEKFEQALKDAEDTAKKANVTKEEVIQAKEALEKAMEDLEKKPTTPEPEKPEAELKALNDLITDAKKIDLTKYTDASVQKFSQALKEAEDTAKKTDVTKEEANQAKAALQKAIAELEEKPTTPDPEPEKPEAELKALNDLITDTDKIDLTQYTGESVAKFEQALKAAKAIAEDPNATKEELAQAKAALQKAIDELNKKPDTSDPTPEIPMTPEAELKALNDLIADAEKKDLKLYTDDTVAKFNQALKAAKETAKKSDATKEELGQAKAALQKAMDGLKKKSEKTESQKENSDDKAPKTGDVTFFGLTGSLAALSGAVALILANKKK